MDGVVLAAGEGTRLRPLTAEKPKGLVEVAGRPILAHCFRTLVDLGVDRLVVVVGYRGGMVRDHFGDAFEGTPIAYVHQAERRGTAHALSVAGPELSGEFLVINGDNVYDADLSGVVRRHRETGADATLLVDEVSPERAREAGVFELDDDGGVTGLVEKPEDPPSTRIPRGLYAFSGRILAACELVTPGDTGEYELTDAVDLLVYAGRRVETVPFEGWCRNVNTPADRRAAEQRLE